MHFVSCRRPAGSPFNSSSFSRGKSTKRSTRRMEATVPIFDSLSRQLKRVCRGPVQPLNDDVPPKKQLYFDSLNLEENDSIARHVSVRLDCKDWPRYIVDGYIEEFYFIDGEFERCVRSRFKSLSTSGHSIPDQETIL